MTTHSIPIRPHTRGPQIKKRTAKITYRLQYDPTGDFKAGAPFGKDEVIPSVFAAGTEFTDRAGGRFVMTAAGLEELQ